MAEKEVNIEIFGIVLLKYYCELIINVDVFLEYSDNWSTTERINQSEEKWCY